VQWKQETPWLREAPAHALQQAILDLDRAYTNFFERRAKFPKFHKKGVRDSFRESDQKCIKLEQGNNRIQSPKIGWVRYRNSREVLGEIRSVTVSQAESSVAPHTFRTETNRKTLFGYDLSKDDARVASTNGLVLA